MRAVLEATAQKNYEQLAQGVQADLPAALRRREGRRDLQGRRARRALRRDRAGVRRTSWRRRPRPPARAAARAAWRILRDEREVQASPRQDGLAVRAVPAGPLRAAAVEGDRALRGVLDRARGWWRRWCWRPRAPASWSSSSEAARAREVPRRPPQVAGRRTCSARTCDADCRGKLVDVMLSSYGEAQGDYDEPLQAPAAQPRAEAGADVRRTCTRACSGARSTPTTWRSSATACWCRR